MRAMPILSRILFLVFVLGQVSCEQQAVNDQLTSKADASPDLSAYTGYAPSRIDITPLTEVVRTGDAENGSTITVYVSLLDSHDSQIKSPGIFRFELYEYAQRSSDPKGRRVVIWPDIDLTAAAKNNEYWRDFLRAYEFNLDCEPQNKHSYILQVTCMCPDGKRLSTEYALKHIK